MAAINNNDPQLEIYRQRIFNEVEKGNLVVVKEIAKQRPELLNSLGKMRFTLLHYAAAFSKLGVIEWLLSDEGRAAGFNSVLAKAEGNTTALHAAADLGNLECVKAIVYGCKVENGEREEMLNVVNVQGFTVLHSAAMEGKPSIAKWLLSDKTGGGREAGFHNIFATETGKALTALHKAAKQGNLDCFKAIVEGCKVENGEREKMLNSVSYEGGTVLHVAAQHGNSSIVRWLMSKGRELGFTGTFAKLKSGITALHVGAFVGNLEICKVIVAGCKEETGEREEMLNAVDNSGRTVLNFAADSGHSSIVSWLLSDKKGGGRAAGFKGSPGAADKRK